MVMKLDKDLCCKFLFYFFGLDRAQSTIPSYCVPLFMGQSSLVDEIISGEIKIAISYGLLG